MAYSKARRLSDSISATGEISAFVDGSITHADLHTNMDLTGKTVLVPNASTGDSDTTAANTAFVQQEIAALVDSAPGTLNTLNELAAALGDDASFSTTVTNSIALKAPLASPDFTGQLQATNSATTTHELIVTGNNTRSALSVQSKDASGGAVDLRMHSLGDGPRGEIFTYTNHDLAFATNNAAPQVILKTDGNFGIGTTSPDRKLDVSGTGNVYGKFQSTNATGAGIEVKDTGEDWLIQADDGTGSGGLAFYDLGRTAYRMFLDASGNLGIGTTSPATNLHIDGVSNYNGVEIKGTGASRPQVKFSNANQGVLGSIYGTEGNALVVTTNNAAAIAIDSSQRVGIGDTNPQHPFKVHLTNGEIAMFGSNGMNSPGNYAGIGLGQVLANNTTYQKVSLVTEGRNSGNYVQDFHILVDTAADPGSAVLADSKFEIDGGTGAINMSSQPSALIYNGSSHTRSAGASAYIFPSTAYNVGGCYNTSNGRFTVTTPGKYLVTCQLGLNASTTAQTYLAMGPRLNDAGTVFFGGWSVKTGSGSQYGAHTSSVVMNLQANDYLVFYIELSATAVVLGGPHYTSVSVHKLS